MVGRTATLRVPRVQPTLAPRPAHLAHASFPHPLRDTASLLPAAIPARGRADANMRGCSYAFIPLLVVADARAHRRSSIFLISHCAALFREGQAHESYRLMGVTGGGAFLPRASPSLRTTRAISTSNVARLQRLSLWRHSRARKTWRACATPAAFNIARLPTQRQQGI